MCRSSVLLLGAPSAPTTLRATDTLSALSALGTPGTLGSLSAAPERERGAGAENTPPSPNNQQLQVPVLQQMLLLLKWLPEMEPRKRWRRRRRRNRHVLEHMDGPTTPLLRPATPAPSHGWQRRGRARVEAAPRSSAAAVAAAIGK